MATCYRHPTRETGVSCSSCGRPICPDCMTPTSVGMRCPECARERTPVKTMRSMATEPTATYAIIAVNVIAYMAELASGGTNVPGTVYVHGALFGPLISGNHEYWRLLTSGFLHANILHILLNMYFIYVLGMMLEPSIGRVRFVAVYFASLFAGSFGALLLTPHAATVGASGAAFGLLGCAIAVAHRRGLDVWSSGLVPILLINLGFGFVSTGISIGAHLGGAVAGFLIGAAIVELGERRGMRAAPLVLCVVIAVAAVVGGIAVAGQPAPAPNGLTI
jgi:membrane associated rhomboid family serine protease